ncbi:DUF1634 domain-containing protein [Trichlorobacter ammonificans]|uniref:DUF1634 domain-containing protein n=1 Tax=Trichlorobacter ammonificans TaxID=2916410 RepID=A0ABN8HK62_9BACT|nr:DUF1634 domain-containing protein [Trichlorobacter ammonificans]CAH2031604.1 conserved membrane protein of unknown function [Trichlorobacter ammonificans]
MSGHVPARHAAIETVLARLLRLGSLAAAVLLAGGVAIMLSGNVPLATGLISAGLIALMATPVLRVLTAGLIFIRERDWLFALFCLVVLCTLVVGIILGSIS